jgi:hypothetical protein
MFVQGTGTGRRSTSPLLASSTRESLERILLVGLVEPSIRFEFARVVVERMRTCELKAQVVET